MGIIAKFKKGDQGVYRLETKGLAMANTVTHSLGVTRFILLDKDDKVKRVLFGTYNSTYQGELEEGDTIVTFTRFRTMNGKAVRVVVTAEENIELWRVTEVVGDYIATKQLDLEMPSKYIEGKHPELMEWLVQPYSLDNKLLPIPRMQWESTKAKLRKLDRFKKMFGDVGIDPEKWVLAPSSALEVKPMQPDEECYKPIRDTQGSRWVGTCKRYDVDVVTLEKGERPVRGNGVYEPYTYVARIIEDGLRHGGYAVSVFATAGVKTKAQAWEREVGRGVIR